jgi:hypothetical protein
VESFHEVDSWGLLRYRLVLNYQSRFSTRTSFFPFFYVYPMSTVWLFHVEIHRLTGDLNNEQQVWLPVNTVFWCFQFVSSTDSIKISTVVVIVGLNGSESWEDVRSRLIWN